MLVEKKQSGEVTFKLDKKVEMDPSMRRIVNFLLKTDIRKHNRYCPCCKKYEEGEDLNADQMGEFLEYIKQIHEKLSKGKKKFDKLRDLPDDSISEISDLSNEGILSTSLNKLSILERKRLSSYVSKLRQA